MLFLDSCRPRTLLGIEFTYGDNKNPAQWRDSIFFKDVIESNFKSFLFHSNILQSEWRW
jgi:hypothetical protein